jgi:hypothetical protein
MDRRTIKTFPKETFKRSDFWIAFYKGRFLFNSPRRLTKVSHRNTIILETVSLKQSTSKRKEEKDALLERMHSHRADPND